MAEFETERKAFFEAKENLENKRKALNEKYCEAVAAAFEGLVQVYTNVPDSVPANLYSNKRIAKCLTTLRLAPNGVVAMEKAKAEGGESAKAPKEAKPVKVAPEVAAKILAFLPSATAPEEKRPMTKEVAKAAGREKDPSFGKMLFAMKALSKVDFQAVGTGKRWFKL